MTTILDLFGRKRADRIEVRNAQWCVTSEDGTKDLGCFDTEEQANERLRQVEAAKAAKGDSSQRVDRIDYLGRIRFNDEGAKIELELEPNEFEAKLTPEGYLKIEGMISGTGVYEYSSGDETWGELRTADEVFSPASLDSFKLVPVTDDHPASMVDSSTIKDVQAGHLGSNVRPDGDHVRADMLITDAALIAKIKDGKTQLSCGYQAVVMAQDGTTDAGVPFSAVQTEIRGNHLSVVDLARGGPTCSLLLDSKGAFSSRTNAMKVQKKDGVVMVGETQHEVPDEVAAAFDAMRAKMEEQAAELAKLSTGDAEEEEKPAADEEEEVKVEDTPKGDMAKMQATIDSLLAERDTVSSKIDARVSLVVKTREILGADAKTDGVSDINLMRAVVSSITPAMKAKVDKGSADYVSAAYEMAVANFSVKVDSTSDLMALTHEAHKTDGNIDLDALYTGHLDSLRSNSMRKEAN